MLDQKKFLSAECDPIVNLMKFENNIRHLDVERPIDVRLTQDGQNIKLTYGGVEICGVVDRPLIHQLGSRLWKDKNNFSDIEKAWQDRVSANLSGLQEELSSVFRKNDLSIRYSSDSRGQNTIYGIVTPHFVDVNQLDFRQKFIETIRKDTSLQPESEGIKNMQYGQVVEFFKFDTPGFQTTYKYGLVYARNNGYESYRVNWGREVLICSNGLTQWKGSDSRWKHTKEIDLKKFISQTISEGIGNQHFLEERINASKERPLQQFIFNELMVRLSLAQASKKRILNRLDVELNDVGNNEWALSQTLTWLGTHEKYVPPSTKPKLIHLGTRILEKSLASVLNAQTKIGRDGYYGIILPADFPRVRQQAVKLK